MGEIEAGRVFGDQGPVPGALAQSGLAPGGVEGQGGGTEFTPVELLLAAIGGCTAIDVDLVTSRRAEPDSFRVDVQAAKVNDAQGHRLTDIVVTFKVAFPDSDGGQAAREVLPNIVRQSHDRLCTVSRTVEIGTPVTTRIE